MTPTTKKQKNCDRCKKGFIGRKNQRYCSSTCANAHYKENNPGTAVYPHLTSGTVGAVAELLACADLMVRGCEVFRAVSPSSNCDLLAIKNGVTYKIEVRTGNYSKVAKKMSYPVHHTEGKNIIAVTHSDSKIHYIGWHP